MASFNLFGWGWFEPTENYFRACIKDVKGLNINAKHISSNNIWGTQDVESHGATIGEFYVKKIHPDLTTEFEIAVPKKFNIPVDSSLGITYKDNYYSKSYNGNIEILTGKSIDMMKTGDFFPGFGCPI
jgi:hypothetical protein